MFGILNLKSAYSMLQNTIFLPKLIEQAKKASYDVVALSDHNLHGMVELYQVCEKHQLKPVLGLQIKVSHDLSDTSFFAYVKNDMGFENLLKISLLQAENKLDDDLLFQHQKGLIFVTAGKYSLIDDAIDKNDLDLAKRTAIFYQNHIDDLYFGLSLDTFHEEMKIAPMLFRLSEHLEIPMVPIHQTSYLLKEEKEVYEALIKIDQEDHTVPEDANYAFLTKEELIKMFTEYPFVFDTLSKLFESIDFHYQKPHFDMPTYPVEEGTSTSYLRSLSAVGLKKRLRKIPQADIKIYQKRLTYELDVIEKMGYQDYFLIVYDFVKYAKTHDILVGPGRGSAAGSLVAFTLGITDVDPITYDLLFERFLNPERITMPDIDMDFPDNKRDEVLQYVKEKYGAHHMIQIVTFGTFALRSSIRDIARVMKIDPSRVTGIIQRVINDDVDETDHEMMRLLRVAKAIEGLPRHTGTHAAGMILSKQDLLKYIPLQPGINQFYQSQLEASTLEKLGLLKIDFLGIRNLAVIDEALKMIENTGHKIHLLDLPLDDTKTYELLAHAETTGIFQLESSGMRAVLRKLKPRDFEDIVAILALYRPGPMDHIDEYIERRNCKPFTYLHPDLEHILKKTYGIIIYQEQIMQIASAFAGYTLAEADLLRRGISKKDKDILENERIRFVHKSIEQGYSKEDAQTIYDLIVKFADYGFNRSHSVAYALVAYQMAYLKANYFAIFMTILLTSVTGNESLTLDYLTEVKRHHIGVLPPDINKSCDKYIYQNGSIILPLLSVKSIGRAALSKIVENRDKEGEFKDYQDFKRRMKKEINDKNVEMLIHAGALNSFGLTHHTMDASKQIDQAGYELYIQDFTMQKLDEYPFHELQEHEKDALGFNIKYHPITMHEELINTYHLNALTDIVQGKNGTALALIKKKKVIKTKQGKPMAFIELDDGVTQIEATMFTEVYQKYESLLGKDVYVFKLRINDYRGKRSFLVDRMLTIEDLKKGQKI
ncbi:MAG: DNA polymerase III subunit alpha [Acholeplasmataceae bacterium]|jgi:DNA polymerase-3 subunit alpha|nr:DNA polymerase III subunit alpha [Acholeplasmataceae bacterium]